MRSNASISICRNLCETQAKSLFTEKFKLLPIVVFNLFWSSSEDVMEIKRFETAQWVFFQGLSKAEGGDIYEEPVPFIADIHTKSMLVIVNAIAVSEKRLASV